MAIDRRTLLRCAAAGVLGTASPRGAGAGPRPSLYLGAGVDGDGAYRTSAFTGAGARLFDMAMPGRGHSFAVDPGARSAVVFARRPGTFALVVDLARGRLLDEFATSGDRHFYGHGAFSRDGRRLYATENDYVGERGVVGIYAADRGYRRIGEIASHGIGPHDIALLGDGDTLVVANGGILTRPDLPRVKLNVPTMSPSLCYIDRRSGALLERRRLGRGLHRLSIRHLAVGAQGTVAVAMQYEGPARDLVPLVASHRRGEALSPFRGPARIVRAMKQYCGSVCFESGGRMLAVSSPRGHVVTFWHAGTGAFVAKMPVIDGSGVAPGSARGEFLVSGGDGSVLVAKLQAGAATSRAIVRDPRSRWDNHLVAAMPA